MYRCSFCSELAVFECLENRFCLSHRSEHDKTHTGVHNFKDVNCQLSEETQTKLNNNIVEIFRTLKECKKSLSLATAEYIKEIQAMLSNKLAEIDKISEFYITLVQKAQFDKENSVEIDKIISTSVR